MQFVKNRQFANKQRQGFTVIELIVVVVLVAIVSVFAASRYLGRESFSAYTYQETITAVIRQIQVNRMQSNLASTDASATNANYILQVSPDCIGSVNACSLNKDGDYQRSDVVRSDSATFSLEGNPSSNRIEFDLKGNPSWSGSGTIKILIQAEGSSAAICIHSQGYIQKDC